MSTVKDSDLLSRITDSVRRAGAPFARPASDPTTTGPFPVEPPQDSEGRLRKALRARFRLPTEDDTPPAASRLLTMTAWAAACVFIGVLPAGRVVVSFLIGEVPGWYPWISISIGLMGVGLITAAFASIHRAHLPWHLLSVATLLLGANVALAAI